MQVSAIQNLKTNQSNGLQAKKSPYSVGVTRELQSDNFSKQNVSKNISFRGGTGTALGAIVGAAAALAIIATGGLATPIVVGALAAQGACLVAGHKIDESNDNNNNNNNNNDD